MTSTTPPRYNGRMTRKIRFLLILILPAAVVLTGCTATRWTWQHPDRRSDLERQQDLKECLELARQEVTPYHGYGFDLPFAGHPYSRHHHVTFRTWSYHDSLLRYESELDTYTRICMKARGWQCVRVVSGAAESKE